MTFNTCCYHAATYLNSLKFLHRVSNGLINTTSLLVAILFALLWGEDLDQPKEECESETTWHGIYRGLVQLLAFKELP